MNEQRSVASTAYDPEFFQALRQGSRPSAHIIVLIVLDWLQPQSLVDRGCGDGTWLSVFHAHPKTYLQRCPRRRTPPVPMRPFGSESGALIRRAIQT
jgi:hypothetical protein